ncbi:hypothetical protein [Paenibacillus sp. 7516]|uniref:hypothetical protein n=1 Tax=Paenibacillus sp. 7516 TaxID=2022549 RepID=UPI000BA5130F|nr:hypothetical protein [Paenibacillus sp. 7516]PAF31773.1 hypothetical protein CHI14_11060 [Paenibacillus sp. 7516]
MSNINEKKQRVSERYHEYLFIIYHFGNKVILMKQLFRYARILGLAQSYSVFYGQIKELAEAEIIRREPFTAYGKKTQLHMLTLKKFGIRFVEGKGSSQSVAAVPKSYTNERILVSIFKNCYILNKLIPRIQQKCPNITVETVIELIDKDHSNILESKNQGVVFLYNILDCSTLHPYLNSDEINYEINRLTDIKQKRLVGLVGGASSSECKDQISMSPKLTKLDSYSIDSLINAHVYIAQVKIVQNKPLITLLLFDVYNKQAIYRMATQIACAFHMFGRYFNDFSLRVGIVGIDDVACRILESEAEAVVSDFFTKEIKGSRLSRILADWRVSSIEQELIQIRFTHYDITNQYLEGIKHSNLIRK